MISFYPALMTLFSIYCLFPIPAALSLPLGPPLWSQYRYDTSRIGATRLRAGPSTVPTDVFSFLSGDLNSIDGSSAIASDGTSYFQTSNGKVIAVQPGIATPLWVYDIQATSARSVASPALTTDGRYLAAVAGSYVCLIDVMTGLDAWPGGCKQTNNQYPFVQSPTTTSSGLVIVPDSQTTWAWNITTGAIMTLVNSNIVFSLTFALVEDDPVYGLCLYGISSTTLCKVCPSYSTNQCRYSASLPEGSITAPVIVKSLDLVFVVTSSNGYIRGFTLDSLSSTCQAGPFSFPITVSPSYIGNSLFSFAFVISSANIVAVTSATQPCTPIATLPLNYSTSQYSSFAIDKNSIGFIGDSSGRVNAISFQSIPLVLLWSLFLNSSTNIVSSPSIGAGDSVYIGSYNETGQEGALWRLSNPIICGAGSFLQTDDTCADCAIGTYNNNGTSVVRFCTPCSAGRTTIETRSNSSSQCVLCSRGSFSSGQGGPCLPCLAGSYAPSTGSSNCTLCKAGTASSRTGATSSQTCEGCFPGSASATGAPACTICISGTYASSFNSSLPCSVTSQQCFTERGSTVACGASLPYAQFAVATTHSSQANTPGPERYPNLLKVDIFSGQASLPLSGIAIGPSGGVVSGKPFDSLLFIGLTDDFFGVSLYGAVVCNYNVPAGLSIAGSPAIAPWGTVFVVSNDFSLFAFAYDIGGDPLWRHSTFNSGNSTVTPPAVHNTLRLVYYSAGSSGIVAVDAETGVRRWTFKVNDTVCSTTPSIDHEGVRVYFGCDDYEVYCVDAITGTQIWKYRTTNVVRASPAVSSDSSLVYVASNANNLLAIDTLTGQLAWSPVNAAPAAVVASPAVAIDSVIVATQDGTLFAANGSYPKSLKWSIKLDGAVSAAPTLGSNGTVYVATESGNVYGVTVSSGTIQWQVNVGEPLDAPPVLTLSGALIVPSRISSSIYTITGLAASPSATATASASASATATASATASSSSSGTASATATSTATIVSITPSSSPITSSSPSSASTNNGNNASAKGELDSNTVLALGVSLPVVFISLLLVALYARGNLRINSAQGHNGVAEWKQTQSRPTTTQPVETTSLKSVSIS